MEGMNDIKSDGSIGDETETGKCSQTLIRTMLLDLSAVKVRPAYFIAIESTMGKQSSCMENCGRHYVFRSSIKGLICGKEVLFR